MTAARTVVERREGQRRRSPARVIPPNATRCGDCGTIWYSRLADQLVTWAHCARCDGTLHTERRDGRERRR